VNIKIKSKEIPVLKRALNDASWMIYNEEEYGVEGNYKRPLSLKYKRSLLKNLALIEHRLIDKLYKEGYYTKRTGNSHCWWMWTTTDPNWEKIIIKEKRRIK
tara:strand:+ start:345 stop:650 length:306 start_codon:yes stop_codon:yes gene_type:complete